VSGPEINKRKNMGNLPVARNAKRQVEPRDLAQAAHGATKTPYSIVCPLRGGVNRARTVRSYTMCSGQAAPTQATLICPARSILKVQTAAIGYRVADFLKQHPPFQGMEETDLLQLVSRGRVKFHEIDEFLCWQGAAYAPLLFVLQQGSVSLWEEVLGKELLRDILGPGDMVGIERFLGSLAYPYSAKANSDVVVYALPAADFAPLLEKYPHAARYVDAHAAAGAVYHEASRRGPHEQQGGRGRTSDAANQHSSYLGDAEPGDSRHRDGGRFCAMGSRGRATCAGRTVHHGPASAAGCAASLG
jgi:Cyclic nucleotide-binding domain